MKASIASPSLSPLPFCFISDLLSCGTKAQPTIFHQGCRKIYLQTWRTLEVYGLKECYTVPSFSLFSCCSISDISLFPFFTLQVSSEFDHSPTNQPTNRYQPHQVSSYSLHYVTSSPVACTLVDEKNHQGFLLLHTKKKRTTHLFFPRILLAYSTVMFILSTTHVSLAVSELLQGFVYKLNSTPGGPPVFYRINVFPQRKAIYLINVCVINSLLSSFPQPPPSAFVPLLIKIS